VAQGFPSVVDGYLADQEILCFYGTQWFIPTITKAQHFTLSTNSVNFTP